MQNDEKHKRASVVTAKLMTQLASAPPYDQRPYADKKLEERTLIQMCALRYACARALASQLFVMMLDPANRGQRFTWDKFPESAGKYASANLHKLLFECTSRDRDIAGDGATSWAHRQIEALPKALDDIRYQHDAL